MDWNRLQNKTTALNPKIQIFQQQRKPHFKPTELRLISTFTEAFKGNQVKRWPAMLRSEICLTWGATPFSIRFTVSRIFFFSSQIPNQTAGRCQVCFKLTSSIIAFPFPRNKPMGLHHSGKILHDCRTVLLWVKGSVAPDSPVIIGCWTGAAASAPWFLGQLPDATRHHRTVMQAANQLLQLSETNVRGNG